MINKEKVIKGLETCKWECDDYDGYWPKDDYDHPVCVECPYNDKNKNYDKCLEEMHSDALELLKEKEAKEQCLKTKCIICPHCDNCDVDENGLLKEREPRVMTVDEVQPDELVWIEVPQSDEIWPALLRRTDWFGHPTWAMRGYALAAYYLHEGYGRDWRCWTARPTDEQREAVKWGD